MIRCKLVEYTSPDATQSMMRVNRSVSGETLSLGRGASCKIYLPDARVRLEHAAIRRANDGLLHLEADGPVLVDQHPQTNIRLAVGQKITVGPYEFVVERVHDGAAVPEAELTLSYALRVSAPVPAGQAHAIEGDGVLPGLVTRRGLAWVLSVLVLVFFSALPVWRAFHPQTTWTQAVGLHGQPAKLADRIQTRFARLDTFWNPGQISSAHQNFAKDCLSCHNKPFERVADTACTTCHQNTGAHVADKAMDQAAFQGQRCASCHREHQGTASMRTTDAVGCEQCHGNVKAFAPQTTLPDIADFGTQHPSFRFSIRQPGHPAAVQRIAASPSLRNDTGLKFPHAKHLAQAGIKSPLGPPATGGRVVLGCADCHTLAAGGARYAPVRMDTSCQTCHRLSVDPQAPDRQVPHARPDVVATAVREIYASLAVDRFPVRLVTVNSLLQRPAGESPAGNALQAGRWVQTQSELALAAMFEQANGVCKTCHEVTKTIGGAAAVKAATSAVPGMAAPAGMPARWQVKPVVSTDHWLPKSRFSHAQHKEASCVSCHSAQTSTSAADILVPDIATCRTCHVGAVPEKDKVVSRCDSCHGFHGKTEHPAFRQQPSLAVKSSKP